MFGIKSPRGPVLVVLGITLVLVSFAGLHGRAGVVDDVDRADKLFADHSYGEAAKVYRRILDDTTRPVDERSRGLLRLAECLRKLTRWDDAITELGRERAEWRGTIHDARRLALRGAVTLTMPHWYYQKGEQRSRQNWIQGATYHYTYYDDLIAAMKDLEEAAHLMRPFLTPAALGDDEKVRTRRGEEFVRVAFDMAAALEAHRGQKGGLVEFDVAPDVIADQKKHGVGRHFSPKPRDWFALAEKTANGFAMRDTAAFARYLDAQYCRRILELYRVDEVRSRDDGFVMRCAMPRSGEPKRIVAVSAELNPLLRFEALEKDYAGTKVIDEALYSHATLCRNLGLYVDAVKLVDQFFEAYPKSRWRSDMAAIRQDITFPRLSLDNPRAVSTDEKPKVKLSVRNVDSVRLRVDRLDLERLFTQKRYVKDDDTRFANLRRNLERARVTRSLKTGAIAPWNLDTPDRGKHKSHEMELELDLSEPGAYLVEAEGNGVAHRSLLLVSDIAMVRKVSDRETVLFIANAKTGEPVAKAQVLVRQIHRAKGIFGNYDKVTHDKGETDGEGLFVRRHETADFNRLNIEALATQGRHYALTVLDDYRGPSKTSQNLVVYGFTDRPVYRPGHEVHFVGNIRKKAGFDYEIEKDLSVRVEISDPKRNKIFNEVLEADEFGAVAAKITVGEEPPLGAYSVRYYHGRRRIGTHQFRIEEYKLPEFEVSVDGGDDQKRAGDPIEATIHGEYYFGGGVPGAKVAYRVFRKPFWPRFRSREPYRYLYGSRRPQRPRPGKELVMSGDGVTDDQGNLRLQIETESWKRKYADQDHVFVVEADLTDLSRRTISGAGEVVVTRRALYAKISADRGFYRAGETATFEIQTQTPNGAPVATEGRIVVYRVTTERDGDEVVERRAQIRADELATNKSGIATYKWLVDASGRFVVTYVTEDRWNEPVIGEHLVWVTAPNYRAEGFQFKNIEVLTDKREYKPGETAYVMINSNFADAVALVTLEANNRIVKWNVVRFTGKTHVLALDIEEGHAPNVFLDVLLFRNGQVFQTVTEIFVPPTHKFMDVAMKFEKEEYGPGERARIELQSLTPEGQPVSGQFAVRVMDKALTYVQQDTTRDVRAFFYGARRSFRGGERWNTNTQTSNKFVFEGYRLREPGQKNYRRHGMPPGWGLDLGLTERLWGFNRPDMRGKAGANDLFADSEEASAESEDALYDRDSADDSRIAGGLPETSSAAPRKSFAPSRSLASSSKMSKRERARSVPREMRLEAKGVAGNDKSAAPARTRSNFADLAYWGPTVRTDAQGKATIELTLPDSLTTWVATARGLTRDTRVGQAESETRTTKKILARMQAPRFFTEKDEIVLSAVVRSDFDRPVTVEANIALKGEGDVLELLDVRSRQIDLAAKSERRVDWRVRVKAAGQATVFMEALSKEESDAVEMSFPVYPYGIDKVVTHTLVTENRSTRAIPVELPAQRGEGSAELEVTLSPSIAGVVLDSLPYLVEYPYGCTEQTMSRFLPAVMVARTLRDVGISLEDVAKKRVDLANKNALSARNIEPVYDGVRLDEIVAAGLKRLLSMQNTDGGFGWWRADRSSLHLTSYVLYGLSEAKRSGVAVPDRAIIRAAQFLERETAEIESLNPATYAAFALASADRKPTALLGRIMPARDGLNIYGKAQLALALHWSGRQDEAALVAKNLSDFVSRDEENGTCHWRGGGRWWRWYDDEIETNAQVLAALVEIDPKSRNLPGLVKWLVNNRSGNRWKSTRDTALCVFGLSRYMKVSGELDPALTVKVRYGDQVREVVIDRDNMFAFDNRFIVTDADLQTGAMPLLIETSGRGRLYVSSRLKFFSKEEKIRGAGHEILVKRSYSLVEPYEKEVEQGGKKITTLAYRRTPLADLSAVTSGQEIEVKLEVTAKNNYEYIMLEDRKPSGFEPVALRSGSRYANGLCSNMELRDEKVVFFVTWLQQGTHEITYRMRAEAPGKVHAMPCRAEAMYAPRLGGISDSWTFEVTDDVR